ncbi:ABC transporter permease subunit [Shewanella sp. JM162201]|uniref:ABC transporter permease subunit n=1 Tax=Shewanella jiangmenensis TaxID=2837387 RepID=A0ABS5V0S3_9GAMM|nr:ABC transporter permease subunit [Shewanella jiangmenensis]MBT1444072.1 ABC transporter permease subunit [Shewanella jiangmenensis]
MTSLVSSHCGDKSALTLQPCSSRALDAVRFIARLEWLQAKRQRLLLISFGVLLLLGVCVCLSFSASAGLLAQPMAALRSLTALWSLTLPLLALMAGFKGIVAEREGATLGLLLTQPVSAGQLLLGKWLGGAAPLLLAQTLAALGSALLYLLVASSAPLEYFAGLLRLWLGGAALTLGCHLSALVVSAWCRGSQSALFLGLLWLGALLLLWDLLLLALLLLGAIPGGLLEVLVLLNPVTVLRGFVLQAELPLWALGQLLVPVLLFRFGQLGIVRGCNEL